MGESLGGQVEDQAWMGAHAKCFFDFRSTGRSWQRSVSNLQLTRGQWRGARRDAHVRAPLFDHWNRTGPTPACSFDTSKSCFIVFASAPPSARGWDVVHKFPSSDSVVPNGPKKAPAQSVGSSGGQPRSAACRGRGERGGEGASGVSLDAIVRLGRTTSTPFVGFTPGLSRSPNPTRVNRSNPTVDWRVVGTQRDR